MDGFDDHSALLKPCVYMLKFQGEVVYIGQSRKALLRLYSHEYAYRAKRKGRKAWFGMKGFRFDEVLLRECSRDELSAVEREMIWKYRPKYNVQFRNSNLPKVVEPIVFMVRGRRMVANAPSKAAVPLGFVRRV